MTTIRDVARLARVSIASASYALNETGTISADTRKRVLEAAEQLNYHPNAFARNLKKPKTRTIGVFITRFGGSFYEEILEGIHEEVLKTEYELIVCPDSRTKRKILTYRQVDGAIVFDTRVSSDIIARLASKVFPIVVLDRLLDAEYVLPLLVENRQGVIEAFHHLYDQGARKICFISGALDSVDNEERRDAFLGEACRNNLEIQEYNGNFTERSGYEIAEEIISGGMIPEAVFCANDQMAIGFLEGMKEHQLKAPDDIAVVGFDDIPLARFVQPSLTTIGASRFMWGSTAASQLINFLEYETPFKSIRMPTKLIIRESSFRSRPITTHRT